MLKNSLEFVSLAFKERRKKMRRNLLLIALVFCGTLFFSKTVLATSRYTLNGTNLSVFGDSGGTVQIDINIQTEIPQIWMFVISLEVTGTCNPVLDTVLTGGRGDINPPGFAPPSLVSSFHSRMVFPYGPPLQFVAIGTSGIVNPDSGLFCRMFFNVTGPGTIVIDTMTDPVTGYNFEMLEPQGPVSVNWGGPYTFNVSAIPIQHGDANCDGLRNISDVVFLIRYLFKGGTPSPLLEAGDVNCDGQVTVTDVIYLVNYLFKSGPAPC
jgi:hypothetical protein